MTQIERTDIKKLLTNQEVMMVGFQEIRSEVGDIHRAVYGDKKNDHKGLIQRQRDDEVTHKKILDDIRPVISAYSFVISGKFWGLLVAVGSVVGLLYKYLWH